MTVSPKNIAQFSDLKDRHVFITGGATGIGAELVRAFAEQEAYVSFIDLDEEAGIALANKLGDLYEYKPHYKTVDVTDVEALQLSIEEAIISRGAIHCLVNNVANDVRHSPEELSAEEWHKLLAVNLDATFFASQAVYEGMQEAGGGSIINFSSINALMGPANMPAYVTAKAGIVGMTKALARDFGEAKVRVNTILPGWVVTDRQLECWLTPEAEAEHLKLVALKDRILPEHVSPLTLFLASDASKMMTGQKLVIDAGRT